MRRIGTRPPAWTRNGEEGKPPALSLCSLSPLFFAGSLFVHSLSFFLCCCFYLCLLRKGANPSRALLSFPRRILLARGFPSRAGISVPAQAPRPLPRAAD